MSRFLFLAVLFAMLITACGESSSTTSPEQESSSSEIDFSSSETKVSDNESQSSSSNEAVVSTSSDITTSSCSEASSSDSEKSSSSNGAESSSDQTSESSSSSELIESSSSEEAVPTLSEACLEMRSTQDKFIPLEDVFDCILPKEKLVFVIRHGERNKEEDGSSGDLNKQGKDQSTYLGKKLAPKSSEEFYYVSTKTKRTINTNVYLSKGKGEDFLDSAIVFSNDSSYHFVKDEDYVESWYVKGSKGECDGIKSWPRFTMFAYDTTACPDEFYNVDAKTKEFIDKHFMYDNIQNITVVATHDKFIAPFLISITDRKIGLESHKYVYTEDNGQQNNWNQNVFKHWPNYLAGVAIIVNENNERAFVPVKGLKTGYLGEHCPNNDNEDGLYTCKKWEKDVK